MIKLTFIQFIYCYEKQIGWANIQNKYVYLAAVIDLRGPPRADPRKKYSFNPTLKWLCLCSAETWLCDGERCRPILNHRHYYWMSALSQSVVVRWNCHILCGRETLVLLPFLAIRLLKHGPQNNETQRTLCWEKGGQPPALGGDLLQPWGLILHTALKLTWWQWHLCVRSCHGFFFSFFLKLVLFFF